MHSSATKLLWLDRVLWRPAVIALSGAFISIRSLVVFIFFLWRLCFLPSIRSFISWNACFCFVLFLFFLHFILLFLWLLFLSTSLRAHSPKRIVFFHFDWSKAKKKQTNNKLNSRFTTGASVRENRVLLCFACHVWSVRFDVSMTMICFDHIYHFTLLCTFSISIDKYDGHCHTSIVNAIPFSDTLNSFIYTDLSEAISSLLSVVRSIQDAKLFALIFRLITFGFRVLVFSNENAITSTNQSVLPYNFSTAMSHDGIFNKN